MRRAGTALAIASVSLLLACQNKTPAPPSPGPGGVETIRGTERIGWDQRAADTAELGSFRYAIYVDGNRSEIADVRCETTAAANGFPCNGRLPSMSPGQHTLELATFVVDGGTVVESGRSSPLMVNVTSSAVAAAAGAITGGEIVRTTDGLQLRVELVATQISETVDLAFDGSGRLFAATRSGTIHVLDDSGRGAPTSANVDDVHALLSFTLDPHFNRTRHVYTAETVAARDGSPAPVIRIARYREVNGRLGERAVLLDGVAARTDSPAAVVRFGPDGRLYAAFDDGGDPRAPDSPAWLNGKLLRLNTDGTTPEDQPTGNPVLLSGLRSPSGIAFLADGTAWMTDDRQPEPQDRLVAATVTSVRPRRVAMRAPYALDGESDPSDVVVYGGEMLPAFRGDVLVAANRHILRVRIDPRLPQRIVASEKLLEGLVDSVGALAVRADGVIYFATAGTIARLVRP